MNPDIGSIIPGEAYKYIYAIIVFVLISIKSISPAPNGIIKPENKKTTYNKALILGLFFIIFFGTRPNHGLAMADTSGYANVYQIQQTYHEPIHIDWRNGKEIIWNLICDFMASAGFPVWAWFTVIATIYIMFNLWGIKKIFPNHVYIVFLFYVTFFLFYSGGINGIRNADAYSIAFFALSLYTQPKLKNYILIGALFLVAYQIHSSVIITITAFIASIFFVKRTNLALLIWIGAIIITLVAGSSLAQFASTLTDDGRAAKYLEYANDAQMMREGFSHTGFRWDFLLFSALPIALGWYVTVKRSINDQFYQCLLNTYILANAIWIIFIYAAFSNRFAMLSWCIYPYVLCYPLVKFNIWPKKIQHTRTSLFLWTLFIFSLYMNVIQKI